MKILNNQALKLALPPDIIYDVTQKVSRATIHNDGELIIYWGHTEISLLTYYFDYRIPNAALPSAVSIPSPMLRDYKWPGVYTPYEHQKATASFLSLRARAFCFSEMGVGKTGSAIWAAD